MKDIIELNDGEDLKVLDSIVAKSGNVTSTQLASLEYAPDFGVDKKYFLQQGLQFQTESYRAYLVQRLIEHRIQVSDIIETVNPLSTLDQYYVGEQNTDGGLIL